MYSIQIDSPDDKNGNGKYQTSVLIKLTNNNFEKELLSVLEKYSYYLNIYINPLFWLINLSPMIVYIRDYQSELGSSSLPLKFNEKMNFSFKNKLHQKRFETIVLNALKDFLKKQVRIFNDGLTLEKEMIPEKV